MKVVLESKFDVGDKVTRTYDDKYSPDGISILVGLVFQVDYTPHGFMYRIRAGGGSVWGPFRENELARRGSKTYPRLKIYKTYSRALQHKPWKVVEIRDQHDSGLVRGFAIDFEDACDQVRGMLTPRRPRPRLRRTLRSKG